VVVTVRAPRHARAFLSKWVAPGPAAAASDPGRFWFWLGLLGHALTVGTTRQSGQTANSSNHDDTVVLVIINNQPLECKLESTVHRVAFPSWLGAGYLNVNLSKSIFFFFEKKNLNIKKNIEQYKALDKKKIQCNP
jgi:hypothetical protein